MKHREQNDWLRVIGEAVQIRNDGQIVRTGRIEVVTNDGAILWLAAEVGRQRQLIVKADGNEVWMPCSQDSVGSHGSEIGMRMQ